MNISFEDAYKKNIEKIDYFKNIYSQAILMNSEIKAVEYFDKELDFYEGYIQSLLFGREQEVICVRKFLHDALKNEKELDKITKTVFKEARVNMYKYFNFDEIEDLYLMYTTDRNNIIFAFYAYFTIIDQLKSYIKELKEITNMYDDKKQNVLNDWQKHLKNKQHLFDDGKRVVNNLEITVKEYVEFTKKSVTAKFIKENFKKSDGADYSSSAIKKARDYANTHAVNTAH